MAEIIKNVANTVAAQGKPDEDSKPSNTVISNFSKSNDAVIHETTRLYFKLFYKDKLIAKVCYLIGTIALMISTSGLIEWIINKLT